MRLKLGLLEERRFGTECSFCPMAFEGVGEKECHRGLRRSPHKIHHYRHMECRYYVPVSIPVPETAPNIDPVPSVRSLSGMLAIASVFAIVGGFLDAYSYLARGHVFANAQTGNVVLFGVRAAAGNWTAAWETLPSILAYMCGVAVARLLRVRRQKHTFRATLICQALELFVLPVFSSSADS